MTLIILIGPENSNPTSQHAHANYNCSSRHFDFFFFIFFREKYHDISCEPYALQTIHMKWQVLFSLKNNNKTSQNIDCYNFAQHFKGLDNYGEE